MSRAYALLPRESPLGPDLVLSPLVYSGPEGFELQYPARDGESSVRATFEGWDATRFARGASAELDDVLPWFLEWIEEVSRRRATGRTRPGSPGR